MTRVVNLAAVGSIATSTGKTAYPGAVLQVVTSNQTLAFSSTSGTFTSIGLAASITPSASTNKIFVIAHYPMSIQSSNMTLATSLYRGGSAVLTASTQYGVSTGWLLTTPAINYLDSPSTTSSTTYTIYGRIEAGSGTISATQQSVITLIEIAA